MKYCTKCKTPMEDYMLFCPECGQKAHVPHTEYTGSADTTNYRGTYVGTTEPPKKKRRVWITVLLWVFFLPIMSIIAISKSQKIKKPIKAVLIVLVIIVSIGVVISNQSSSTSDPSVSNVLSEMSDKVPANNSDGTSREDNTPENSLFADVISDEALRLDFISACEQIGMDAEKIDDLKQVDDWVSGTRYSFTYSGGSFRLYCNMDSTVNCIKLGDDTDIYKQGYEPYQISDYIVDSSICAELRTITEDYVKKQLNYPATADFPWLDWSYGRERDLYSVSSKVTAKNAFGVKDELEFCLIYQVDESSATVVYFDLDGTVLVNNMASISIPERKKIEGARENTESETGAIVLKYGELGEYGKTVTLDGSDYINYYVPAGTYTITNNGKWCKIYLAKDEYFKNSDGYMENEIIETIEFSDYGETKTIVIGSGEHLELTINATVTLTTND